MLEKFTNIFRVPDLRKRVLFTLAMLAVYRLGSHIPTPGIDTARLADAFKGQSGGLLGFYAFILSAMQGLGIAWTLQSQGFVMNSGPAFILMTIITLTTGSVFIMWLGEQITERGVGNGMSLLIFAGIVVGLPRAIEDLYGKARTGAWGALTPVALAVLVIVMVAVVAFIVFMERGERRIPVQYAKRVVGRRIMGGQATHLPLRVNSGGVMPVIFASSLLSIPQMLSYASVVKNHRWIQDTFNSLKWGEPLYTLLYCVGIVFFAYFYVSIVFNPADVADNMRKYGGFIPGIRPGHRTRDFINQVLTHITFIGGLYLILISLIPEWMIAGLHINHLPVWLGGGIFDRITPNWILNGLGVTFYFGGTSLLIVVGVAMDTVNQIESQLIMRHYEGFTPRSGRIRGRRIW
ncbi:MAG: preprotein translocase subunit SecY [Candidatus Angelobacter sp. Gp1-AA117]|nr:MAG: preprotein translocase subunit SecY [Candidatus Angelobacter sp. Gp1-AA117]